MATYYVRKSGNDGNGGESAGDAWLTIDKAANEVAAGDTVYIGSGVYRELVTMDTAGTSGNQISFIGDIDGSQTGDAGPVILTAHDSETAVPARNGCIDMNGKEFIVWQYIIMVSGLLHVLYGDTADHMAYEGVEIKDCAIIASGITTDNAVYLNLNSGATPSTTGLVVERCYVYGNFTLVHDNNASAHVNLKATIQNNVVQQVFNDTNSILLDHDGSSDTYSIGGVDIVNCTFLGNYSYCVIGQYLKNTTNQVRVLNCIGMSVQSAMVYETNCTNDAMYEDYNFLCSGNPKLGDVEQGGNSDGSVAPFLLGGLADLMFYKKMGWSPYKPWEPMRLLDGTFADVAIEAGSSSFAPADDLYGMARPMGRTPADDAGAVEARIRPQQETGTTYSGSNAAMLAGTGYVEFLMPVDAESTTVTVWGRYDSSYTGTLPTMKVIRITGDSDQSDVMTGAADNWEQLSCTFTPTASGYVTIQLWSYDTSGSGEAYFDLLEGT